MEKITITRIGQEKTINYTNKKTGQPDSFKKVGVLTNEYGDRWFDITFRGEVPVKVGQTVEVDVTEREYTNKEGVTKTYYDAKLPQERRSNGGGGMNADQWTSPNRTLNIIQTELKMIRGLVDPEAKLTSAGTKVPDFSEVDTPAVEAEAPEDQYGDVWGGVEAGSK